MSDQDPRDAELQKLRLELLRVEGVAAFKDVQS